jgi:hypothetical protein
MLIRSDVPLMIIDNALHEPDAAARTAEAMDRLDSTGGAEPGS